MTSSSDNRAGLGGHGRSRALAAFVLGLIAGGGGGIAVAWYVWHHADPRSEAASTPPMLHATPDEVMADLVRAIERTDYAAISRYSEWLWEGRRDVRCSETARAKYERTFLAAVQAGDVRVLESLQLEDPVFRATDERTRRAIHIAAVNDRSEVIEWLIKHGMAGPNDPVALTSHTPLHLAAEAGSSGAIASLLRLGADPMSRISGGITPLMTAAAAGRSDSISVFCLESGVRRIAEVVDARDEAGRSALDMAMERGDQKSADILRSVMSK